MCRIAGILDKQNAQIDSNIILMRDAMERGGPDSAGVYVDSEVSLALGHRRLSIIDLTNSGSQPMQDADGELVLVFNGEIYNFESLKSRLQQLGHRFRSESDTEVILKGYLEWGNGVFQKLKGMFAIALYNKRSAELVLARDHAGIKPLYYYHDGEKLYFASEIRAFQALRGRWQEQANWRVQFLTYGFLPAGVTTLNGVTALEKGSCKIFDVYSLASRQVYFYQDEYSEAITDPEEAKQAVATVLDAAVKRHMIADAPLGVFLSGGIDSSLITILAKRYKTDLQTLSITFGDAQYDESSYQQLIAKKFGTSHQAFPVTEQLFKDALPDIFCSMDQPTTDGINSYFISKYARAAGLKAVLSGLGADELFGGYPSFRRTAMVSKLRRVPSFMWGAAKVAGKASHRKFAFLQSSTPISEYLFNRGYYIPSETARVLDMDEREVTSILNTSGALYNLSALSGGNRVSVLESNVYMQHQLLKDTDFMSMWHGLEVRVPFLDLDLVQLAQRISSKVKFDNAIDKFLLINSFRSELPQEIWNRKKQGFAFPFATWMKESLDDFIVSKKDQEMRKRFYSGALSWSRYWAFIMSKSFSAV